MPLIRSAVGGPKITKMDCLFHAFATNPLWLYVLKNRFESLTNLSFLPIAQAQNNQLFGILSV